MTMVLLISYVDRNTLALLAPLILKETGLNAEQYGWIISAFSVAYMIGNPVWGRVLDRVGIAGGMAAAVGFWTLASVSHAFAAGFWSFAIARAALGFGEGATFPGGLRTVVQTLDARLRSRGIAVAYGGGSLGAVITPVIVTPIALWWGWRGAFWFTGFVGALWLAWWSIVSRREDVRRRKAISDRGLARPSLLDPRLWSFMASYALGAFPLPSFSTTRLCTSAHRWVYRRRTLGSCYGSRLSGGRWAISSGDGWRTVMACAPKDPSAPFAGSTSC